MYNVGHSIDETGNMVEFDFAQQLPHGSGIDSSWEMENKGSYIYFTNSYHCMNEAGYYDGWQDFRIRINATIWNLCADAVKKMRTYSQVDMHRKMTERVNVLMDIISEDFQVQFTGGSYKANKYMLSEYLEDTIAWSLKEMTF